MNLRDLRYLVAVAEHEHFGRAAESANVSQPALSGQIKKLEEELDVVLFERTNRRVRITSVGEAVLHHARAALQSAQAIEETARAAADPMAGILRLGLIHTIGPDLTPLLMAGIRRTLPRVKLSLVEGKTTELEAQLADGTLDAIITATEPEIQNVVDAKLYTEPFWIALPNGHPLAARDEIGLTDIAAEELLLLSDGHCLRDQVLSFCAYDLQEEQVLATQDTSLATILALVGSGAGVTLVPALAISGPYATDAGVAFRKESGRQAGRQVRLVYRKTFPRLALTDKLADIIAAILPDTVTPVRR